MEKRLETIDQKVEYFKKILDKALENVPIDQEEEITKRFHARHPRYASLLKSQLDLGEAINQKWTQLSLREGIHKRLSKSKMLEEVYLKVA